MTLPTALGALASSAFERAAPGTLPELMDAADCDRERLSEALDSLGAASRWLGGARLLRRQVRALAEGRRPGPIRVLDVGSGGGDAAVELYRHLRERGWSPRFVLADRHARTLSLSRERVARLAPPGALRAFRFVRTEGVALPFGDGDFEIALSAMTLHHLETAEAPRFLEELARTAAWGWAVTDMRRSRLTYGVLRLLAATLWRSRPFPRRDGPVSVLRSFTPAEARRLAEEATEGEAILERRPFRWALRAGSGSGAGREGG